MYSRLNSALEEGLRRIDALLDDKIQNRAGNTISSASWTDDSNLSTTVNALKDVSKVAANSCLKFVLLLRTGPSEAVMASLVDELYSQSDILLAQYL